MSLQMSLQTRIEEKTARVTIVGQGYVGLPLAVEFARAGFRVTGLEADPERVAALGRGESYIPDVPTVVLESTTYPGTTEEVLLPMLEERGLSVGRDFFLAFSPERIDPGNPTYRVKEIPKLVGGITPACTRVAAAFYRQIVA